MQCGGKKTDSERAGREASALSLTNCLTVNYCLTVRQNEKLVSSKELGDGKEGDINRSLGKEQ